MNKCKMTDTQNTSVRSRRIFRVGQKEIINTHSITVYDEYFYNGVKCFPNRLGKKSLFSEELEI